MLPSKRVISYLKPHKRTLLFILITGIISSAIIPGAIWLGTPFIDKVIIGKDITILPKLSICILLIFGIGGLAAFFYKFYILQLAERIMMLVRNQLYEKFTRLSMDFYTKNQTGAMLSRATNDVQMLYHGLTRIEPIIKQPLLFLFLLGYAIYVDWFITVACLLALPVVGLIIYKIGRGIRRQAAKSQQQFGTLSNILSETFVGIRIIKAFRLEKERKRIFRRENGRLFRAMSRSAFLEGMSTPLLEFLTVMATVLFFNYMKGYLLAKTAGELISLGAALALLRQPLKSLNEINIYLQRSWAAADRIFEILDLTPSIEESKNAFDLPPIEGEVRFDKVAFKYDDQPILENISFTIKKGETIALVGSSGAGKSTLLNLLPRFYDVEKGSIKIDGIDVRLVTLKSLREQISYVSQEVFLFHDTIEKNISFGNRYKSFAEIEDAARMANIHEFILSLPNKYQTIVGDRGIRLSGGERQRVSIARAVLKDAPILMLDEATSSLDSESEKVVQEALDRLMSGRTTLVVAHRLSTIQQADRIIVLEGGSISEEGTHAQLLAKNGVYAKLYRLQFGREPEKTTYPSDKQEAEI
ncbi:MAG: hypothetical protein A3F16_07390 [Deltaproteobacteria bacterium RIFCSPHIGHO2_12_FULL_43_9]|nr:MAG: hypothetical protein A3F16_07390 [Deltaproteobacteria bacterium RIFCSPHIGHO2_12_FULL_43_9]